VTPKARTVYRCAECGSEHPRWAGRCDDCGEWNTLVEEVATPAPKTAATRRRAAGSSPREGGSVAPLTALGDVRGSHERRWSTGLAELDFVLGGGVVPGSMVLIGGEPGIGKSTLLLQVAARLTASGHRTLYVSGEESPLQIKLRADRLAEQTSDVSLLAETQLETILATGAASEPRVMFVDSIQTVFTADLEGAPGNVGQVRECAARLMRFAKESGTAVIVVGHVTKGGGIAGPKTLEHIVDTVLYFEGEGQAEHRVLRATKNRFGSADEIGVFRMTQAGLEPVENPSSLFLAERHGAASGTAVTALMEGTRPLLVEIQALAAKAGFGTPQRVATGYDSRRLALLLAVLDKRAGLNASPLDVFVNVVGGLRMNEPAGDLAVAAALASSVYDRPLPADAVFLGEIGLAGEIRAVTQADRRLAEADRLGMRTAYLAPRSLTRASQEPRGRTVTAVPCATIGEMFEHLFG
jgi:DNA repair protein RadA/Sms